MFKLWSLLGCIGFFTYDGLHGMHPTWWPEARVRYPEGPVSRKMAIGNAWVYARIFGGDVIPPLDSPTA
jgi:hypothetical protein